MYNINFQIIDQNVLSSNQIAEFFYQQNNNMLSFLHRSSYQIKVTSNSTTVGLVWSDMPRLV